MCEKDTILNFTNKYNCGLQIVDNSKHYFHTEVQLRILEQWLEQLL